MLISAGDGQVQASLSRSHVNGIEYNGQTTLPAGRDRPASAVLAGYFELPGLRSRYFNTANLDGPAAFIAHGDQQRRRALTNLTLEGRVNGVNRQRHLRPRLDRIKRNAYHKGDGKRCPLNNTRGAAAKGSPGFLTVLGRRRTKQQIQIVTGDSRSGQIAKRL